MFLMSRNYTLQAPLPREPDSPAALTMPDTGVYHLAYKPTWMPNVATFITRIPPRAIPPRDFEFSIEEIDEDEGGNILGDRAVTAESIKDAPLTPLSTWPGAEMVPRDQRLLDRYAMHRDGAEITAAQALAAAIRTAGLERGRLGFDYMRVLGWLSAIGLQDLSGNNALNIFKEIRMVKSPTEIELLKMSGRMSETAFNAVIDAIEPGLPLEKIGRIHATSVAAQGGRSEWIIANKEYRGDVGRSVFCGEPTREMLQHFDAVGRAS